MSGDNPKPPRPASGSAASPKAKPKPKAPAKPVAANAPSAKAASAAATVTANAARAKAAARPARAARDIGLDVRLPKAVCHDMNCPFHGHLKVRGQVMEGVVVSAHMQGSVVVSRTVLHFIPKYERYEKRRRRYLVHSPPCIGIKSGRQVMIAETRPISKGVCFVVVQDLGEAGQEIHGEEAKVSHPSKADAASETPSASGRSPSSTSPRTEAA